MTGTQQAGTPARIIDILETDGMWMTADALEAEIADRFDAVTIGTIRRAVYRLINDQRLEHRLVDYIDYNVKQKKQTRGAQATPSGFRLRQIMEVRAA